MRFGYLTLLLIAAAAFPAAGAEEPTPSQLAFASPMEKKAWIGVSVSPAPGSLRHQLKIAEGIGLVVDFIQPKSPAEEAGLKPYDLLLKLDDQWLVNPEQFAVLVRMHHAGDEVKLTFIREGKEQTAGAKLIEHEVPRFGEGQERLWIFPGEQEGHPPAQLPNPRLPGAFWQGGKRDAAQSTITWFDGRQQITVVHDEGHATITVTDPSSGQTILKSPIDTEEQRNALPANVRDVLKNVLPYDQKAQQPDKAQEPKKEKTPSSP